MERETDEILAQVEEMQGALRESIEAVKEMTAELERLVETGRRRRRNHAGGDA